MFSLKIILMKTMAPLKQKLTNKIAFEKCKALKDLEKGMSLDRLSFKSIMGYKMHYGISKFKNYLMVPLNYKTIMA